MNHYNRHAIAPLDAILPAIKAGWDNNVSAKMTFEAWSFNIHSLRLRTFCRDSYKGSLVCSCCGLKPEYFAVESFKHGDGKSVHINLYGRKDDGEEILFTHDHTKARSLGGVDNLSNTTTMCWVCNNKKGNEEGHEVNMRRCIDSATSKISAHQQKLLDARTNPASIEVLEIALNDWASKMTAQNFAKKIDNFLQNFGWKRKVLEEKIDEGVIKFTLYPVKG